MVSVTLSENSLLLSVGESKIITASVLPENATDKKLFWLSTDTDIVVVDQDGKVTANAEGSASIIAISSNPSASAVCNVVVKSFAGEIKGLKARAAGMNIVSLTWEETPDADGYIVLRNGSQIGYVFTNSFTDGEADADNFNFYWVIPFVNQNGKVHVGKLSGYVWALGRTVGTVQAVKVKTEGNTVNLSWNETTGANSFVILSKTGSSGASFNPVIKTNGTSYSYKPGAGVHFYWVYATYNNTDGKTLAAGKVSPYAWAVVE